MIDFVEPSGDALKRPLVGDVIDEKDALSTSRIRPNDCAEPTLTAGVPKL